MGSAERGGCRAAARLSDRTRYCSAASGADQGAEVNRAVGAAFLGCGDTADFCATRRLQSPAGPGRLQRAGLTQEDPGQCRSGHFKSLSPRQRTRQDAGNIVDKEAHLVLILSVVKASLANVVMASTPMATFFLITPFSPIRNATGVEKIPYSFDSFHFSWRSTGN